MEKNGVIIGKDGQYPLNGILTLPDNSTSKIPAVVLVHGSGAHDMDETLWENKPFRDIAEYLPSKGIAVLRYDKRTYAHGKEITRREDFKNFTVKEETIDDAIIAANFLRNDKRIYPGQIYILGHSLGGMLAPRIDAEGGNFKGIIILAGSPRSIADIIISQNEEMIPKLGKLIQLIAKRQFASLKIKLDAIESMTEEEAKNTKFFGKNRMWYLKEMIENAADEYLKNIEKPILILQGEKDFQVTVEKDFELYRKICSGKNNVIFKLYPELNHLFMKSIYQNIKDFKKEYKVPQKVNTTVLDDIAEFILHNKQ